MRVHEFTTVGPIDHAPSNAIVSDQDAREALNDALRGIEIGKYDQTFAGWLVQALDTSGLREVVSLLARVRQAGMLDMIAIEEAREQVVSRRPTDSPTMWGAGNSGPGW